MKERQQYKSNEDDLYKGEDDREHESSKFPLKPVPDSRGDFLEDTLVHIAPFDTWVRTPGSRVATKRAGRGVHQRRKNPGNGGEAWGKTVKRISQF